jgi:hypothetical protein
MRAGRRVVFLLVTVLVLIAPLAAASLPDQTWLGGLWDGADDDDAILSAQSTIATVEPFVLRHADPVIILLGFTATNVATAVVPAAISATQSRAPPAL